NDAKPIEIPFDSIIWPDCLNLPLDLKLYNQLVKNHGQPYSVSKQHQTITLNHPFFVAKFAEEHVICYEPNEGSFYGYNEDRGLWQTKTKDSVKHQFSADLKSY